MFYKDWQHIQQLGLSKWKCSGSGLIDLEGWKVSGKLSFVFDTASFSIDFVLCRLTSWLLAPLPVLWRHPLDQKEWTKCSSGKWHSHITPVYLLPWTTILTLDSLYSPDGDVIVTNDGATILEKMEVSTHSYFLIKSLLLNQSLGFLEIQTLWFNEIEKLWDKV